MTGHRVVAGTKAARRMTAARGSQVGQSDRPMNSAEVIEHNKRVELQRQQDLIKRQERRLERERWKR